MKFSVLMSIYYKEKPEYFDRAMQSIWDKQVLKPNEIVLVQDGPLADELHEVINKWKEKLGDVLKIIPLEKNVGLGDALNIGLKHCSNEIVARMDTDDVAYPKRFEKQIIFLEKNPNIDVVGSWVSEFDGTEDEIISYRKLPESHNDIIKYAKDRCPINHPTAIYKKTAVFKSGGYQKMMWFEDYYLWARMIMNNYRFANISEPLVNMRIGFGQFERRGGVRYAVSEYNLQKEFLKIGFIDVFKFIKNLSIRIPIRIMPNWIRKFVYKLLRK